MLDRRFIRQNSDVVKKAVRVKGIDVDIDELLTLDETARKLQYELDQAQTRKRALSQEFTQADNEAREKLRVESVNLDQLLQQIRGNLAQTNAKLTELLLLTPAIPWDKAPIGSDDSANVTITTWGRPPEFDFVPLDHVELAEKRDWIEFARARKITGERAYALKGDLLLLERALHSYALDLLTEKGFTAISVPALAKEEALLGSGWFPQNKDETYELPADTIFLAGTSEVALIGLHSGEILAKNQLPIRYAGISTCFRREIGSAGRDVRGMLRVHQFDKVEQFVLCEADEAQSAHWHAELRATAEHILQSLGLHYEVVECSTGDMGPGKFRMNDINTWFPSLNKLKETHSCSTLHDWQARRANLRYRDTNGTVKFAHTLNNTAVATPRLLAALIENHQTKDHQVQVPEVLRPYLGNREVL